MRVDEYANIFRHEETYWWYVSLQEALISMVRRAGKSKNNGPLRLLDAGCGTGGVLGAIRRHCPEFTVSGVDLSFEALAFCRERGLNGLAASSVESLPFKGGAFDVVVSSDVLYHARVADDLAAVKEFSRVSKQGGWLILHLPAFDILKGGHDRVVLTSRRYTSSGVRRLMRDAGFKVRYCGYRYVFMFPVLLFKKFFDKARGDESSNLSDMPFGLNRLMLMLCAAENSLMKFMPLPFGSSVICLAEKE